MPYERIDAHLRALGLQPGDAVTPATWERLDRVKGARAPALLRWLFEHYAGSSFDGGACYRDPRSGEDVFVGYLLMPDELEQTLEDSRGSIPDDVLPIEDDCSGNHLAVGIGTSNSGQVFCHIHDAFLDANLYLVDDSLEHFLLSLHRPSE